MKKKILIGGVVVLVVVLLVFINQKSSYEEITNFEECAEAGNPVMESYPRQCRAGDKTFTEILNNKYCETDSDCVVFGEDGDCNCGCYNKNMIPTSSGGDCFCAAPTSCKCIDEKCEGVY